MQRPHLDKEEQELVDSIESGKWKSVKNMKTEIAKYADYAKKTLKKDQRISIRISRQDLLDIKTKAVDEGIPYQTLISSIVHKYVNGRLASKN